MRYTLITKRGALLAELRLHDEHYFLGLNGITEESGMPAGNVDALLDHWRLLEARGTHVVVEDTLTNALIDLAQKVTVANVGARRLRGKQGEGEACQRAIDAAFDLIARCDAIISLNQGAQRAIPVEQELPAPG